MKKSFPRILRVFFYIVKHIHLNIEPAFRPLVSLSIGICNRFLYRPSSGLVSINFPFFAFHPQSFVQSSAAFKQTIRQ